MGWNDHIEIGEYELLSDEEQRIADQLLCDNLAHVEGLEDTLKQHYLMRTEWINAIDEIRQSIKNLCYEIAKQKYELDKADWHL
jgi:hypothetical protein